MKNLMEFQFHSFKEHIASGKQMARNDKCKNEEEVQGFYSQRNNQNTNLLRSM